ncbi:hypothetical protein CEXT_462571 [Caerostris extrusa]|uniref:Uncharacterized protein n=1 Tax=Caerostris extrusa TaxID=172846 RepID=A0AAV4VD13_CAEEX|nr:hypothetical protein CEXT_462571 [Caerostris extrusa]
MDMKLLYWILVESFPVAKFPEIALMNCLLPAGLDSNWMTPKLPFHWLFGFGSAAGLKSFLIYRNYGYGGRRIM